jgi:hypothetical protein
MLDGGPPDALMGLSPAAAQALSEIVLIAGPQVEPEVPVEADPGTPATTPTSSPTPLGMVIGFATSAGRQLWRAQDDGCSSCGCQARRLLPGIDLALKRSWSTSACPEGRWPAVASE